MPSRSPPYDCALGRLLSTATKTVKPRGAFRRPFGALCYPTDAPRYPGGTLKNKAAPQAPRAILLGYCGDQGGAFEGLNNVTSQPGYICFEPEGGQIFVTEDVRIIPDCFPGLKRTAGGGWCIPSESIPFVSGVRKPVDDQPAIIDINSDGDIPKGSSEDQLARLDLQPGFAPESSEARASNSGDAGGDADGTADGEAPSGGGDAPSGGGDAPIQPHE